MKEFSFDAIVVGSGCAGLNSADCLYREGVTDIALITEGLCMGTSRNTGSDKQTYYKLSTAGNTADSVFQLACDLQEGGMDGKNALTEAGNSLACFYKLVHLGVPFPYNEYGEYVGYQTDHDSTMRATSCGPLTSKYMTEALERAVLSKNIPIFDNCRIIQILVRDGHAAGLLGWDKKAHELILFRTANIVYAVGGPSAMFLSSVYPKSQTCALGAAFSAGAKGCNLPFFQFGIASLRFRWNLSGSYQQVIPTYYSTAQDGSDKRYFLDDVFGDARERNANIFLKGYQWPYAKENASSKIDLAVFHETQHKKRRVFLDFFTPSPVDKDNVSQEAYTYLQNCGALADSPIARLRAMNEKAYQLYLDHGIDLACEPLQIDVCVQHNNGGLLISEHSETSLPGLFAAGECAGVFGKRRPGGSALNSTQVTSLSAAKKIAAELKKTPQIYDFSVEIADTKACIQNLLKQKAPNVMENRLRYQTRMSKYCSLELTKEGLSAALSETQEELAQFAARTAANEHTLTDAFINYDILLAQQMYLSAACYFLTENLFDRTDVKTVTEQRNGQIQNTVVPLSPVPDRELWFETVYNNQKTHR